MSATIFNVPADPNRVVTRSRVIAFAVGMLLLAGFVVAVWPESLQNMFTSQYLPHAFCYLQEPRLVWLHVSSDLLIGTAYVAISIMLGVLVHRARRDIPFSWVFIAFGLFIVACGWTHYMEVLTVWKPFYWLAGDIKLLTAVASVATALALPPLIPRTVAMVQHAKASEERKQRLEIAHTELENLYGKLKQFDEVKTQFFANVSHELRTPLTLILGPTEKLLRSPHLSSAERHTIETVHRNARVLLAHVNDLLDISKFDAGKLDIRYSDVDLARLVRLVGSHFESFAESRNVRFVVRTPGTLPAQVDPEKLQRVLLNLLSNAFKFTPHSGSVSCTLASDDEHIFITVADSGPGVRPEQRDSIFERFQQGDPTTRNVGGTGLGLAIAHDFVEMHGGKITVADALQGGAEFRVDLPLRASADAPIFHSPSEWQIESAAAVAASVPGTQRVSETEDVDLPGQLQQPQPGASSIRPPTVLVVEDNPDMNRFIAETLASDYRVLRADNGRDGLEKALLHRPDLILSDIMMPVMSGDELVRELKAKGLSIPVMLLSARADESLRVELLRQGAQDYLLKPFSSEELLARVNNVISTKRGRDVLQQELATQGQSLEQLASQLAFRNRDLQSALSELRRSESRFRRLAESNIIGIIQADVGGRLLDANDAFLRIIGYTRDELRTGTIRWTDLTPREYAEADQAAVRQMLATGSFTPFEKEYIARDGQRIPVLLGAAMLEGSRDECIAFVVDLSERKRTERALRDSEKLASIGRLAGTIAHEINNPLDAIGNVLYLLLNDKTLAEEPRRYVQLATDEIARVSQISRQMLGFYRESSAPVAVNLASVIDNVVTLYDRKLRAQNIDLNREYRYRGDIQAFPGEMRQVFSNLLINAIEASGNSGKVRVRIRQARSWINDAEGVRVIISDNGVGISPDNRARLFEPFFTTKGEKGTGLGLWVSHGIIRKHGGSIHLRSSVAPGRNGTCFSIFLPIEPVTDPAASAEAIGQQSGKHRRSM